VIKERLDYMGKLTAAGKAGGIRLQLKPEKRFHIRRSQIGDLRSAYLAAFAAYGYRYAYDPRLELVRRQLRQPEAEILRHAWVIERGTDFSQPMFLGLSKPFPGLAVRLGSIFTVLLPWFDSPDDFYGSLDASFGSERRIEIEGEWLGWPSGMDMQLDYPKAS
jgi:hypothetical protein